MVFKVVSLLSMLVAACLAAPPAYTLHSAPLAVAHAAPVAVNADFDPHPQYSYGYQIKDVITGDEKDQHETRDGDVVQGSYSVVDPDGTKRTVEYTADSVHGFNAVVHKEAVKSVAVAHAPVVSHQPIISHSPVYSHQPIISHSPVYSHQPIISHSPVYSHQPIISHQPVISHAPVITHEPVVSHFPVVQHAPVTYKVQSPLDLTHGHSTTVLHH